MNLLILGPAGSGKSLLTANFASYLEREGYKVRIINLDPGVLETIYKADFDVRVKFTVNDIMRREGLGPNGALLKAMDLLSEMDIPTYDDAEYTIYDAPGQLEPFLFRDSGRRIAEKLGECCCLFLGDLQISKRNLLSFYLYALTARYALETETLAVLNKVDLLSSQEINQIKHLLEDPINLLKTPSNLKDEMDMEILKAISRFFPPQRVPLISAKTGFGFSDLLTLLYEVRCACGDLT